MGDYGEVNSEVLGAIRNEGKRLREIEQSAREFVMGHVCKLRRRPLIELEVGNTPGAYFLFMVATVAGREDFYGPLYRPWARGDRPLYIGKACQTGLDSRLNWHIRGISEAQGLELGTIYVATLPTESSAFACFVEAVCLEEWGSVTPWAGSGFGSRNQGQQRTGQKRSMFDFLHQGRYWLDDQPEVDEVARACAALHVAAIAARELPKSMTWDPIVS